MTRQAAHISARKTTARTGMSAALAIAIVWTALMGFQLLRSIRIDAYELSQSRIDLLGYWLAFLISLLLGLRLLVRGRMMLLPLFFIITLIIYITLIIALTAPSQSIKSFLLSRHGVFIWFVLGIGFTTVVEILAMARRSGRVGHAVKGMIVILGILGLQAFSLAREIFTEPISTLSYQQVSSSATIFLLIAAGVVVTLWDQRIPILVSLAYIGIGTVLVIAVALTQSASIVAVWIGILVVFFGQAFRESRLTGKVALLVLLFLGAGYATRTEVYQSFITKTRFAVFFTSDGEFTPLTSRVSLLSTFPEQFAVSPIFGNFEAEIMAGVGEGYYMHSVPLSFLTHTGLVGTALFFSILFLLIRKRAIVRRALDPSDLHMGRMMWIILGVGTVSAFLSWPALWFMMGALCKRLTRYPEL